MDLSILERALLANQFKILASFNTDADQVKNYQYKVDVLEKGYEYLYDDILSNINSQSMPTDEANETIEIVKMFWTIKRSLIALGNENIKDLDVESLYFHGFDPSHENHYHFLKWLMEKHPGQYKELGNLDKVGILKLSGYRRKLNKYNELQNEGFHFLSVDELKQLEVLN